VRLDQKPVTRLSAKGALQAAAVFDGENRVLVADLAGWMQAFSPHGRPLWQRQLEGAVSATPAVDVPAGRVFVGTHRGWVYALHAADGTVAWRQRLPTKSDARIVSDLLFVPTSRTVVLSSWGGQFHALDSGTGDTRRSWDAGLSPQAAASADAAGNLYYSRARKGEGAVCVRMTSDSQEQVLQRQAEGKRGASRMVVAAAPVVDEARAVVYFCVGADQETHLHAWSLRQDRLLWTRQAPRMTIATPAVRSDGALMVAGMDGALRSFSPEGSLLYCAKTEADYLLAGPVCDADGTAFFGDPVGQVHAVDREGVGRLLFETPRSLQARPAFDRQGNLHMPCTDRTVYVFRNRLLT
jgi:outer membrane protein assembly factor BamB